MKGEDIKVLILKRKIYLMFNIKVWACLFPLCLLVNFSYFCCCLLTSSIINFFKKFFQEHFKSTIRVSYNSNPDQERQSVGPDLGRNGFHRFKL